jgi:phosphopantothenoylcysteine decarboxylase/phosphopantothenate--cysteine ligase
VGVQVVATENATRFVAPLALETLSRRRVLRGAFDPGDDFTVRHVDLAREVAALVVAPATANVLAKLAAGLADDALTTFALAVTAPVLVAPAMNTRMLLHPATQANLRVLRRRGVEVVPPDTGWLAEREIGWGRMAEPERIVVATLAAARRSRALDGRTVVVTAGPTRERIDPVRFLSNRSSGTMGFAVAAACAARGARVVLIHGPVEIAPPWGVRAIAVESAVEMREAVLRERNEADAVFMVAAVSDFAPRPAESKIKRSSGGLALALDPSPDILAELGRSRRPGEVLVGFAAETENALASGRRKLEQKSVDWVVVNDVSRPDVGIDADDNEVTILGADGGEWHVPRAPKREIAEAIVDRVLGRVAPEGAEDGTR